MKEAKEKTAVIDGVKIKAQSGATVMEAADSIGVHIPRLCYHPDLSIQGACRVCLVEIKGRKTLAAACSTKIEEGMEILTSSPLLRRIRRDIVELILDNHPKDCQMCDRNGNCELQSLAYELGVRERLFEGKRKSIKADMSSPAIVREPEKCILCGRCVRICSEVQGVFNLSQQSRGFNTYVAPAFNDSMADSICIHCGQCANVCPTSAIVERNNTEAVFEALANPQLHVVVQTAPAVRATIGEGFGYPPGTPATGEMVAALKLMGFDMVFDTNFAADLTVVEEADEFVHRLKKNENLPLITSCSPGWINFMERFYPELIHLASTCRSPMSMMSALLKTYYAEKSGLDPDSIYVAAVMPCTAKKFEALRPEHTQKNGKPLTDAVLTTRELIWMMKSLGIDFGRIGKDDFDAPLGISSGAADIFGTTGGVMEAALRTAGEIISGKPCADIEYRQVRGARGVKEATVEIAGNKINIGIANGLQNAKSILNAIMSGEKSYHIVEIMACPGGCIGGGGQPYPPHGMHILSPELLKKRAQALYDIDRGKKTRKAHDNPSIQELYNNWLGKPGGAKSHAILHTKYEPKLPRGI